MTVTADNNAKARLLFGASGSKTLEGTPAFARGLALDLDTISGFGDALLRPSLIVSSTETQTLRKSCYKHETPGRLARGDRRAESAEEIRERHRDDTGRTSDRS